MFRLTISLLCAMLLGLVPDPGQAAPGDIVTVVGGGGAGDGGPATAASLNFPAGVATDSAGNIYIADAASHVIRKVSAGIITRVAGTGIAGYSGDGSVATSAAFKNPRSVAVDSAGNLYIADRGNRVVRKVYALTGVVETVAGTGALGTFGDGDDGPAIDARLASPSSVALDSAGNLYIADFTTNSVRMVDAEGTIHTVAGAVTAGYSGDGDLAVLAELNGPSGLALDSAGNLYISESFNNSVRKVNAADGLITTVAGGVAAFGGDGDPATLASLNAPEAVTLDLDGNLFIADRGNNRIRKVAADTGIITTVAGTVAGFSGDNGPATAAQLNFPSGVAVDSSGNLYISDTFNNRIRKVAGSTLPVVTASPAAGSYDSAQSITLTANKPATIYYTTDGSDPASAGGSRLSFDTTGQLTLASPATLKYYAVDSDGATGAVSTQQYSFVPGVPTGVAAVAGVGQATVSFTPPSFDGGSAIISYTVTSTPGGISATGLTSPITVTGLTGGTPYTFQVQAVSANGSGAASTPSNSVTPPAANYNLTLSFSGTGGGSVNGAMSCTKGTACAAVGFNANQVVTLIPSADSNSLFSGWSGCNSVSGSTCSVIMTGAKAVTAAFTSVPRSQIIGGASYHLLSAAYAAAGNGQVIQARSVEFNDGDLILNRPVALFLSGGYDTAFSSSAGQTVVKGRLLVRGGTVRVKRVVVE